MLSLYLFLKNIILKKLSTLCAILCTYLFKIRIETSCIKQTVFQMSILVHPDKNLEDKERAQVAFEGGLTFQLLNIIIDLCRGFNYASLSHHYMPATKFKRRHIGVIVLVCHP